MADATKDKHKTSSASIKELLISLVISFTMAFIFRGFAIEGFEIPTGSMGPTLLGKHVLVINPETGYRWVVGPKPTQLGVPPAPVQENVSVAGPMSGERIDLARERLRGGDRLFVLKYLRGLYDPDRWDVVVFRAPHANSNYIKRLIGLPNEQLAIVDGDVFTHPLGEIPAGWDEPSWSIQRKPEIVQRAVWQPMFDSSFTPPNPARRFRAPWIGEGSGWEGIRDARVYRYTRSAATSLAWDHENRPITDRTYYNDSGPPGGDHFPVSDVATSLGIEPEDAGVSATVELEARGMTFRASIEDSTIRLSRVMAGTEVAVEIESSDFDGLEPGRVTNIEFWHADQALWLFIDGKLVAGGPEDGAYELSPAERAAAATGRDWRTAAGIDGPATSSELSRPSTFVQPRLRWRFEGGPFALHRVRLDRDLHYKFTLRSDPPGIRGMHPTTPAMLDGDHFYFAGDNSPNSLDARMWDYTHPWIARSIEGGEPQHGLTHRDLVIGRAFVVYLPAPSRSGLLPFMFDFGRVRWVW